MNYHTVKFGCHSLFNIRVIMILVCHVISQDHAIKGSWDFIDGSPSW